MNDDPSDQDRPPDPQPDRTDDGTASPEDAETEQSDWIGSVRQDRPVLYAARHLIKPVVKLAVAILGIGALLRAALPRIDVNVEWIETWGREHMSWVPDPLGWVAQWVRDRFGEFQMADWIGTVLRNAKWWLPILVAVAVGAGEVLRRWEEAATDEQEGEP